MEWARDGKESFRESSSNHRHVTERLLSQMLSEAWEMVSSLILACYDDLPPELLSTLDKSVGGTRSFSLLSHILCIVYLRLATERMTEESSAESEPSISSSSHHVTAASSQRLASICRWCNATEIEPSGSTTSAALANGEDASSSLPFETVGDSLVFAITRRYLTMSDAQFRRYGSPTESISRTAQSQGHECMLLDGAFRSYLQSEGEESSEGAPSQPPYLTLLSVVSSFGSISVATHFIINFILLPFLHRRSRLLSQTFDRWHGKHMVKSRAILSSHFNGWKTYCLDHYAIEERRKRDLFIAGSVAALRKRRIKMRMFKADSSRLLRSYFDAWRFEGVPISLFQDRSRLRTMRACLQEMKFKQVAVIADRYYLVSCVKSALLRWNNRLRDRRANAIVMRRCLLKMKDRMHVRQFQRQHTVKSVFQTMKRLAVLGQFLRQKALTYGDNPRQSPIFGNAINPSPSAASSLLPCGGMGTILLDPMSVKFRLLSHWRERSQMRSAQRFANAQCLKRAFAHLRNRIQTKAMANNFQTRWTQAKIKQCFAKWQIRAAIDAPKVRRLGEMCDAFVLNKALQRWKERHVKRTVRKESDALCVRYANVTLMAKVLQKWKRRYRAAIATQKYHTQQAFHMKIAVLFRWQKRHKQVAELRKTKEALADLVSHRLLLKKTIARWHAQRKAKQKLLFPLAFAEEEAAAHQAASSKFLKAFAKPVGSGLNNSRHDVNGDLLSEVAANTNIILLSDDDLMAGRSLRKTIFFTDEARSQDRGGGGHHHARLSHASKLDGADRHYFSRLAMHALVQWAALWRLSRHTKGTRFRGGGGRGKGGEERHAAHPQRTASQPDFAVVSRGFSALPTPTRLRRSAAMMSNNASVLSAAAAPMSVRAPLGSLPINSVAPVGSSSSHHRPSRVVYVDGAKPNPLSLILQAQRQHHHSATSVGQLTTAAAARGHVGQHHNSHAFIPPRRTLSFSSGSEDNEAYDEASPFNGTPASHDGDDYDDDYYHKNHYASGDTSIVDVEEV